MDGTLIEAWASQKSFRPKDGSDGDGANFHGQKRKNETHASTSDPDSRLRKVSIGVHNIAGRMTIKAIANPVSVAVETSHPCDRGPAGTTSAYRSAGTTMPPSAAAIGSAAERRLAR